MDKKYINTMYSKDTQEYFDIYDRRIPELDLFPTQVLQVNDFGELQTLPLADISDYENIIQEGL